MPKLYDMWTELKTWLENQDDYHDHSIKEILDKMEELENEHE